MYNIRWTNMWSKETGFVRSIRKSYFESTPDQAEARRFRTITAAENAIARMDGLGESKNNDFDVVEAAEAAG